ncbi:MAG: helix-turn-helix domain-containing protein [Mycobacteriales bacterium]
MSATAKPWLSVRDFADLLGVPERTVRAWRLQGRDPESVNFGRHVRYSREAVDEWITAQRATPRGAA